MAVITGLCDQDHRPCFGCNVSHSEITPIERQLAKLTEPLLEARRILLAGRGLGGRLSVGSCRAARGKRHTQEFTIFSRAGLFRMINVDPFNCNNCFFLESANRRLTVSRVVPIISAISS